jgi:hypothetical protein
MRTIIAGSRSITNYTEIIKAIALCGFKPTSIISGGARGVDNLGEKFGYDFNLPVFVYPANWKDHGKRAGYIRNSEMAKNADALIAIWDGKSKGTKHMIDIAVQRGLKIYVHLFLGG